MKKFNKYGASHLNDSQYELQKKLGITHITPSISKMMIDKVQQTSNEELAEMIVNSLQSDKFIILVEHKRKELIDAYADDELLNNLRKPIMNSELFLVNTTLMFDYMNNPKDSDIMNIVDEFKENPNILIIRILKLISEIRKEGYDMDGIENMIDWNS